MAHCGIDTAFQMSGGEILVRVQDDLAFAPGWLDAVVGALRANPDIGMLGLVLDDEPRRRGRPPKVRPPEEVERVDLRAFAVTQPVLRQHLSELQGDRCADGCRFQRRLRQLGYRIAYLPGQLAAGERPAAGPSGAELEADLAFHPGEREAMARLRQSYRLGEEVLTPCAVCDDEEFEVPGRADRLLRGARRAGRLHLHPALHRLPRAALRGGPPVPMPDLTPAARGEGERRRARGGAQRAACACAAWCRGSAFGPSSTTWRGAAA